MPKLPPSEQLSASDTPASEPARRLFDPFNPSSRMGCACGEHASEAEHDADLATLQSQAPETTAGHDVESLNQHAMETALMRAIFPNDAHRRRFLRAVGRNTAMVALGSVFPLGALTAMAQEAGPIEKKELKIGFIPIICASPLIMADPLGFYKREGLDVTLQKTAGWALIRDKVINAEYDASHMLAPMPIAMSLGIGSNTKPMRVATIQNINGQAITLALKHKDNRDPKNWKGFKFAIPFEFSIHNLLLRYYLAENGLDPDRDVQLRVVPPAEMLANLRAGNIDGFLGPEPFNQRAVFEEVGFIHILSKEIWDGHPCCSFAVPETMVQQMPNTYAALYRAVLKAAAMANSPKDRSLIANVISPAKYLNQPAQVLEQVLAGKFADGLGNVRTVPDRVIFEPFPWGSMAVWILSQLKRWGYVKGDVRYKDLAERIYLMTDARTQMAKLEQTAPKTNYRNFKVMGKEFDPAKADAYVESFAIKRT